MAKTSKRFSKAFPRSKEFRHGALAGWAHASLPLLIPRQGFLTVPPGINSLPGEPDTIDWFTSFCYPIGGDQSTEDGLRRRQEAIEELVAPHVTDGKTPHAIRFKGETCYVKLIEDEEEWQKVWYAIEVLQGIYHIQDARREGDIEGAVRIAYCIGWLDVALVIAERFNCPLYEDAIQFYLNKERGAAKKGKTKFLLEQLPIVEAALRNNSEKKGWLKATTAELVERHKLPNISTAAVSDFIKKHGLREKVAAARKGR